MPTPNGTEGTPLAPSIVPTEVSFDEMEELQGQPAPGIPTPPVDLNSVRIEGENIPEALRGLSAAQLAERTTQLEQALRISEEARRGATSTTPAVTPTAPAPATPTVPTITTQQLREMYENDPLEAMAAMVHIARAQAAEEFNRQFGQMAASGANAVEASARAKYAEEFEMFGPQIKQYADQIPDKAQLANPQTWDGIIAYVRGQNMDKIIEKRVAAEVAKLKTGPSRADAQAAQRNAAPPAIPTFSRDTTNTADANAGLDAVELEICKTLRISPADYAKNKVGGR